MLFAGPATDRQHRAERQGEARDGQQLRRRREVPRPAVSRAAPTSSSTSTRTSSRRIWSSPPRRPARWRRRPTTPTSGSPASSCRRDAPIVVAPRRADARRRRGAFTRGTITDGVEPARRRVAGRHAGRQHHAVEGDRRRALHRAARPLVGGVRHPRAERSDARGRDAARLAVPDRAGPAVARRLRRAAHRLGRQPVARPRPRRADLCGREPDRTSTTASSSSSRRRAAAASRSG